MNTILYVYDNQNLDNMRNSLSQFAFFSFTSLIHQCENINDIEELETTHIENKIFDLTNVVVNEVYYRAFIEKYLLTIDANFDNVYFCLQANFLETFKERFPYLFDKEKIDFDFVSTKESIDKKNRTIEIHPPMDLYVYKKLDTVKKLYFNSEVISLSDLVEKYEGLALKYNLSSIIEIISKKTIKYIDLTSIIKMIETRNDLIFQIEILIHRISEQCDIKYCILNDFSNDTITNFPLTFVEEKYIDSSPIEDIEEKSAPLNMEKIHQIIEKITYQLKGHSVFKDDFKQNLLKFIFLNKIKERKILSIFLCGASGIGKTEFAKIASSVIYEGEPLTKINFGNYSSEGVLNSLIGSPLGYIGSEEGGELINKISESESKIILIDEFERATPSVYNFFYELLEDGVFTDRHGKEHNLNEYIIIFTSNMTEEYYQKNIPDSLKSRFDMIYRFEDLKVSEKRDYINATALKLVNKLNEEFGTDITTKAITKKLSELENLTNLRNIKRSVEDIIFTEFYKNYTS